LIAFGWINAACRAQSRPEFASKLSIVVEEADESPYWLELLKESALIKPECLEQIMKEADEILAIVVASRKTVKDQSTIVNRKSSIA